jgi:formylglycine-generating enzyme required for sulfatase activity
MRGDERSLLGEPRPPLQGEPLQISMRHLRRLQQGVPERGVSARRDVSAPLRSGCFTWPARLHDGVRYGDVLTRSRPRALQTKVPRTVAVRTCHVQPGRLVTSGERATRGSLVALSLVLYACHAPRAGENARLATLQRADSSLDRAMVVIHGGTLARGRSGGRPDEAPRHEVVVSDFAIDETLVTRRAFAAFVKRTHYVTTAERLGFGKTGPGSESPGRRFNGRSGRRRPTTPRSCATTRRS